MARILSIKVIKRMGREVLRFQNERMEVKSEGNKLIIKKDCGLGTEHEVVFPLESLSIIEIKIGD